jgi:hypothetical protein
MNAQSSMNFAIISNYQSVKEGIFILKQIWLKPYFLMFDFWMKVL